MYRNLSSQPGDGSDGSAPSEAWLFPQAILGKPIPKIVRPEALAKTKRAELEQLAKLLPGYADELRRLQTAEAKARHDRELLEWAARISTEAADKHRALEQKEATEREACGAPSGADLMVWPRTLRNSYRRLQPTDRHRVAPSARADVRSRWLWRHSERSLARLLARLKNATMALFNRLLGDLDGMS